MAVLDAYLDPVTGDLPAISRFTTGLELVQQRIRMRLRRGTGEWFLDPDGTGLPLIAWREAKPPPTALIAQRVELEIRSIPGVVRTANFAAEHDPATRRVTVAGEVFVDTGESTAVVIVSSTSESNSMGFGLFFGSNNVRGGAARPSTRRP